MPVGGAEVGIGFGKQSAKGTEYQGNKVFRMLHLNFSVDGQRLINRGQAEIGGQLLSGNNPVVLGARPQFSGDGEVRLGSIGKWIRAVGFNVSGTAGTGTSTIKTTFAPVTQTSNTTWPYHTLVVDLGDEGTMALVDSRLANLEFDVQPGQPLTFRYSGNGIRYKTAVVSTGPVVFTALQDETAMAAVKPSPAKGTIDAMLGLSSPSDAQLLSFGMSIEGNLDLNNQQLTKLFLADLTPTRLTVTFRGAVVLDWEQYRALELGTPYSTADATGEEATATAVSGALDLKFQTPDNLGGSSPHNTPGHIRFTSAGCKYFVDQGGIRISPDNQVIVPFSAYPTSASVSIELQNGIDGGSTGIDY